MKAFSPVDLRPGRKPQRLTTLRVQLPEVVALRGAKVRAQRGVGPEKLENKDSCGIYKLLTLSYEKNRRSFFTVKPHYRECV